MFKLRFTIECLVIFVAVGAALGSNSDRSVMIAFGVTAAYVAVRLIYRAHRRAAQLR